MEKTFTSTDLFGQKISLQSVLTFMLMNDQCTNISVYRNLPNCYCFKCSLFAVDTVHDM